MARIVSDGLKALALFAFYGEVEHKRLVEAQLDHLLQDKGTYAARKAIIGWLLHHVKDADAKWSPWYNGIEADYPALYDAEDEMNPIAVGHVEGNNPIYDEVDVLHGFCREGDDEGAQPAEVKMWIEYKGRGMCTLQGDAQWTATKQHDVRLWDLPATIEDWIRKNSTVWHG